MKCAMCKDQALLKDQTHKQRTVLQNRSLHKYLTMLSAALNDAGYDMRKTLKPAVNIPWNEVMAKEHIWRRVQIAMTGKRSTTELNTVEMSEIYEVLNRHIAEKFGVHVEWPKEDR